MTEQPPAQSERWIQGKRGLQRETYETPQDHAQSTENEARRLEGAELLEAFFERVGTNWSFDPLRDPKWKPTRQDYASLLDHARAALSDAEAKLRKCEEALREIRDMDYRGNLHPTQIIAQRVLTRSNEKP